MPIEHSGAPTVDVISASFADLPPHIPPPPIRRGEIGAHGEVTRLSDTSTRMTWSEPGGEAFAWDPESGAALMLRTTAPNGYDRVSPMRWLVHWSVVHAGGLLIHGACVGRVGPAGPRGMLLLGEAGYGKSTTTLGCLNAGWVTCGDDAVAVFPDENGWHARPVYGAVKTKLSHSAPPPSDLRGDSPATVTWDIAGHKRVHLLTSTDAEMLADRIELDALVLLTPDAPPDAPIERMTAATARTRAAPSTALPLPFEVQTMLARIGTMAAELPAFALPRRRSLAESVGDVGFIAEAAQPQVSVIMPVYDGERYIAEAIDSIVGQSVGRFQIVVVDDASPDESISLVESKRGTVEAAGHRLHIIRLAENQGIGYSRGTGVDAADGDFIAFLDQDDTWPANRTAVLLNSLRRDGASVGQGRMTYTDLMPELDRPWVRQEWFAGDHQGFVMGAVLCRREVFAQVGRPDPAMRTGTDDTDWFLRVTDGGVRVAVVPQVVVARKVHDRNQSRRTVDRSDMFTAIRAHLGRQRSLGRVSGSQQAGAGE